MRRPSRLLGAPRSQECHAPDLTSGNQECASVGYARTPPTGRRAFAGQSLVSSRFALVCSSFSLLRSLVPLVIGNPTAERFSARPVPYLSPSSTPSTAIRPPLPPGSPAFCLARLASLNACQVLACPQSCGELSNSEIVPYHRVQTSVPGPILPTSPLIMHPFFLRLSFFDRALVSRVTILCRRP